MNEHVILVAVVVNAEDRATAQDYLMSVLPRPDATPSDVAVDSWWIAEDDRRDGSDNDSAVFVRPGDQEKVASVIRHVGLSPDGGYGWRDGENPRPR